MFAVTFLDAVGIVLLAIIWLALAFLPASIARSKGHSFALWFVLSLFFWWITLFVTLFMHDRTPPYHAAY
ncbi:MAG TPA: hypothetical protein VFN56_03520 [Candidatus Saccharimonadales bacterium]|nr:hypothetical protein [Candidatus Saccharimonadales bacterium]